ncbi:MAG: hypothetical protein JNL82_15805 [Myxococcales bacterium]|nr:hypothetical protein [Myxococcales bacterium]
MKRPSRPVAAAALLSMSAASCGDSASTSAETTNVTTVTPSTGPSGDPPASSSSGGEQPTTTEGHSGGHESSGSSSGGSTMATEAIKYDVGSLETGDTGQNCDPEPADATLEGTVVAPNLVIPVSGALVYASATAPEGVPNEVYCLECVALECDTPYALTEADGSFSLPVASGMKYVVVQKGQFMRVTPIEVVAGVNPLGVEVTSLPDRRDEANGMYIPNIALALGSYDRLEDALGKLGLADTIIDNNSYTEKFVEGTEQFDMWSNQDFPDYPVQGSIAELVGDYAKLSKYHILFVPCSDDPFITDMYSQQAKDNIRQWVAAGGKFYVADWSNEYLFAGFGQYQTFHKNKNGGGTDLLTSYDSLGKVLDGDMLAWLEALPEALKNINPVNGGGTFHPQIDQLPQLETVDNWSGVLSTPKVLVDDGKGGQIDVGHKIWIEGPGDGFNVPSDPQPLTITGQYGCGKIMFTTYHMAEFQDTYIGLTPQELVLLYLILEIGVCQKVFEPPPPPD